MCAHARLGCACAHYICERDHVQVKYMYYLLCMHCTYIHEIIIQVESLQAHPALQASNSTRRELLS